MEQFLDRAEIARRLSVSVTTVDRIRANDPSFPLPVRVSSQALRWPESGVSLWLEAKRASDVHHLGVRPEILKGGVKAGPNHLRGRRAA